jgi:uncharacterized OB-fold protein
MKERPFSDISFDKYLNEDKLMGCRCKQCNFTCIAIGPSFMRAEGYDRHNPYCSGVVALEEGARVDARIEGVDTKNPESISVGMPLRVKFLHREEQTYLAFEPA